MSVLLTTARVCVTDRFRHLHGAHTLVDSGLEVSNITEHLAQTSSPRQLITVVIFGNQQTGD